MDKHARRKQHDGSLSKRRQDTSAPVILSRPSRRFDRSDGKADTHLDCAKIVIKRTMDKSERVDPVDDEVFRAMTSRRPTTS
jgi:hypothetical protein